MTFDELGICTPIVNVLKKQGYKTPTKIQQETIPSALQGRDILGLAQTGSGKTAAFAIPTLQQLAHKKVKTHRIQSLILTPTRELALQIYESFQIYGKQLPLKSAVIFGGVNQNKQVKQLQAGVDILIATPGRLLDLMNQRFVDISQIEIFILDEADRMLDMGFIRDIHKIIKYIPKDIQTLLFSATMPKEIEGIVDTLLHEPKKVVVTPVSSTVDSIEQYVYYVDRNHKIDLLKEFMNQHKHEQVLIFTRTKRGSDKLMRDLAKRDISAKAIHGNKSQNARQIALTLFKNHEIDALIATDIASRGIDIQNLKYVINYDLPEQAESYVHRIGRTGRAGKSGLAISYCSYQEIPLLKDIEKLIKKRIQVLENIEYPMIDKTEKKKKEPQKKNVVKERREDIIKKQKRKKHKRVDPKNYRNKDKKQEKPKRNVKNKTKKQK
ncbi:MULTISPECIES: DEAD/DEAH box helicase [unclassified Breznakia]|uniref:DEAD/DEAH box helicase n=1 Tax=unclassified Breznakia TaxID=2623764 RepID=UPI0024748FD9|nr:MULTISPECIES: DEAD/DEAH box helicase [unclassified Breznakia]MDH6366403.1 ATP-dependent RNA helicase RhlE [Breznakia sp. PH1-1]MDH6403496.1 ATP-dependent RNA helicase RhlE [Breznakia sp. PF1-11]MDH6411205.1 ATP-dependent RNA helicase RhlE [Breznakia sp. PFB1-11]MDH6413532.1 ATP-dependent RNA helicase RhlE [Breznakia sp. PFB1-14]MDH6415750.1 ATP-dependent RNA helicase RhlE [Breznakia sp. PFB1-4]